MTTPLKNYYTLRKNDYNGKVGLHGLRAVNRKYAIAQLTENDAGIFSEKMIVSLMEFLVQASPEDLVMLEISGSEEEEKGMCHVQSLGPFATLLIRSKVEIDAAFTQYGEYTSHELKVIYDVPTAVAIFKPLSIH